MNKNKINIFLRFKLLFTVHPWLKLIALALAIVLWFYVKGEKV
ncbi:MAG: hypothetical protein WC060_03875 [Candidatus Omnitrophota bacterium]|jgi:hypothetical protein|nr:hypothetical protein [Candidatus Omnitrophota bacterium]MDD5252982.1 hypothetical protein [Candidatus Omnitrophota bacterium]